MSCTLPSFPIVVRTFTVLTIHIDPPALDNEAKRRRQVHQLAIERVHESLQVGLRSNKNRKLEVIANEAEAAIGFPAKPA